MIDEVQKRKTDKRTIYTKTSIKKEMLEMMKDKPFVRISVKELCERIKINRTTFYIHYNNTKDVLIELIDEFLQMEIDNPNRVGGSVCDNGHTCPCRLFDKIHANRLYGTIFFDEELKPIVISRIAQMTKDNYVRHLMNDYSLNKSDAESIYYFQINGCLAVNKIVYHKGSGEWEHTNDLIASFIHGGLGHFKKKLP